LREELLVLAQEGLVAHTVGDEYFRREPAEQIVDTLEQVRCVVQLPKHDDSTSWRHELYSALPKYR
jgi:hypothetical protein